MWLIPWTGNIQTQHTHTGSDIQIMTRYTKDINQHILQIDCLKKLYIVGIKIYNYNKSNEDTYRGIHQCLLYIDHQPIYLPMLINHELSSIIPIAKAPGTDTYDYGQLVYFTKQSLTSLGDSSLLHVPPLSSNNMSKDTQYIFINYYPHQNRSYRTYSAIENTVTNPSTLLLPLYPSLHQQYLMKANANDKKIKIPVLHPQQDTIEPLLHPCGFEYKFVFDCNCGDMYYLGLDCIALYDTEGFRIPITSDQIYASPASINELSSSNHVQDVRVPSNFSYIPNHHQYQDIVKQNNSHANANECILRQDDPLLYYSTSYSGSTIPALPTTPFPPSKAWLSPLNAPRADHPERMGNIIIFRFHSPVSISMVRIFNYSKTPSRGAGRVQLWIDNLCVCQSDLQPAPEITSNIKSKSNDTKSSVVWLPRPCCTLAFTNNSLLIQRDNDLHYIKYCGINDQDVAYYNDGKLISKLSIKAQYAYNAALEAAQKPQRPYTAIPK